MLVNNLVAIFVSLLLTETEAMPKPGPAPRLNYEERLSIFVDEENTDHVPYAELALNMTERYISPKTNTLIIMENCEHCKTGLQNKHTRLLRHFLKKFTPTMALQLFFGLPEDKLWDYNLFIVDSEHAFNNLSIHIPVTSYEHQFHFFVVLTLRARFEVLLLHMRRIFEYCMRMNVNNVVIMTELQHNTFGFYAFYPFDEGVCRENMHIIRINIYSNATLQSDHLFAPQERNLHGCSLNVCLRLGYPYLGFHGNQSDSQQLQDVQRLSGIEADLLKNLVLALNFNVNISIPEEKSLIGRHNNSTGCFAELASGRSDVAIGCMSISDGSRDVFSYSTTYHQSHFVFIVRRGLHFGPIKQLAQAFCGSVWLAIAVCCIGGLIFIRLIISHTNPSTCEKLVGNPKRSDCTNLIITMMGNPLQVLPRRNSARMLLMTWLLTTLVLRNAYQAKLFDTLRTSKRLCVPHTIAGLEDKSYILLADNYVEFYPQNMTQIVSNTTRRYRIVQNSESTRYTTFSMLDTLGWHNRQNWNTSRLTYVPEPIYLIQLSVFFKKHSILRSLFDHRIKQLMGAGITSHIYRKHVAKHFQMMNESSQRMPVISSNMLKGLYLMYAFLMATACTLFGLELLARNCLWVKRFMDWMHLIKRE